MIQGSQPFTYMLISMMSRT